MVVGRAAALLLNKRNFGTQNDSTNDPSSVLQSIDGLSVTINSPDFTIDLREVRLLRELALRGTVAAAAASVHLTPSAVSQQIAGLSRELGVPLLERRGRGVGLTSQARLLLTDADAVQEQLELTRAALSSWSEGFVGDIRIGSLATGIGALVGPAIIRLRGERRALAIRASEVDGPEALALLVAGELDLVILSDRDLDERAHRGVIACLGDDRPSVGVADQNHRCPSGFDRSRGGCDIVGQREGRVLNDPHVVSVGLQEVVHTSPPRAIRESAMN